MRQSPRREPSINYTTPGNDVEPLLGLIDYLRPEVGAVNPTAERLLGMARDLLSEDQRSKSPLKKKAN